MMMMRTLEMGPEDVARVDDGLVLDQAFADPKYTKDNKVSCINWYPAINGKELITKKCSLSCQLSNLCNLRPPPTSILNCEFLVKEMPYLDQITSAHVSEHMRSVLIPRVTPGGHGVVEIVVLNVSSSVWFLTFSC